MAGHTFFPATRHQPWRQDSAQSVILSGRDKEFEKWGGEVNPNLTEKFAQIPNNTSRNFLQKFKMAVKNFAKKSPLTATTKKLLHFRAT